MPIPVNWVEPVSWVQFEEDFVENRTKGQTKLGRSREVIMRLMTEFGRPPLDGSSLDLGLMDEELSIRNKVREFAKEILRPAGVKMDKLPSSETAKPSSPWHSAYQGYKDLGLDDEALFFSVAIYNIKRPRFTAGAAGKFREVIDRAVGPIMLACLLRQECV